MKTWYIIVLCVYAHAQNIAQNVGINTSTPANRLSVSGNFSVGDTYTSIFAPTDGAIIKGSVGVGSFSPSHKLHVAGGVRAENCFFANDGTVTQPSFTFTGASTLGIYRPATNVLGFITNNNERLRIDPMGNVGIGVTSLAARLHVGGTVRVDSLPNVDTTVAVWNIMCDASGNFFKKSTSTNSTPVIPSETIMEFEYGETLPEGILVSVGDGKSAYMRCNGDGAFIQNESTNQTRWVAQGFTTMRGIVGIRAVNIKIPITSGQNTVIFSVCPAVSGVPNMSQAISRTETWSSTSTSSGWSLFVFDPPIYAPSVTPCFLVVRAYGGTNTAKNIRTVGESINGTMAISSDAGSTWSTVSNRDIEVQIYESRHFAGKVYGAHTPWLIETLRPDQVTVLATSGLSITKDLYDRTHNMIGVTLESGNAGDVKKISLGPIVTLTQILIPGTRYYLTDYPGILGLGVSYPFFNVPVGFAVDTNRLYLTR